MKRIIAATLLVACSAADTDEVIVPATQLTQPSQLTGTWSRDGLSLQVTSSSIGFIYDWRAPSCSEGGFLRRVDGQLTFSALFPQRGCWSHVEPSGPYSADVTLSQGGALTLQLSVWGDAIELQAE